MSARLVRKVVKVLTDRLHGEERPPARSDFLVHDGKGNPWAVFPIGGMEHPEVLKHAEHFVELSVVRRVFRSSAALSFLRGIHWGSTGLF